MRIGLAFMGRSRVEYPQLFSFLCGLYSAIAYPQELVEIGIAQCLTKTSLRAFPIRHCPAQRFLASRGEGVNTLTVIAADSCGDESFLS